MTQVIQIKRRTIGAGAPVSLALAELAYNNADDTLYIGDVSSVVLLVGPTRQLELTGDQSVAIGAKKTISIDDLKLIGGANGYYVQTDGNGNLSFTQAVTVPASLVPVSPTVAGATNVQLALQNLEAQIAGLTREVQVLREGLD